MKLLLSAVFLMLSVGSAVHAQDISACAEDESAVAEHLRARDDARRILDVKTNSAVWRDAAGELNWGERKRYIVADFAALAFRMGVNVPKGFSNLSLNDQLALQRTLADTIKSRQAAALATTREALQGTIALKDEEIAQLNRKKRDGKCTADKEPAVADISGSWYGSNNTQYILRQSGNSFTWNLQRYSENGSGTIDGNAIKARWSGNNGSGTATGQITEIKNGRATRIVWSVGIVFSRN